MPSRLGEGVNFVFYKQRIKGLSIKYNITNDTCS
jgi:hypothetical protein